MPLTTDDLLIYLRETAAAGSPVRATLDQIVGIANGIVEEVTGTLAPEAEPARVKAIRFEIAARAYRNPAGHTSGAIDDYRWGGGTGRGGVHLSADERAELQELSTAPATPWAGSLPYRSS